MAPPKPSPKIGTEHTGLLERRPLKTLGIQIYIYRDCKRIIGVSP